MNCCVPLRPIAAEEGVIVTVGSKTVMPAVAVITFEPHTAVTVLEPAATPVASPVLAMVAAAGFEELQVTELVTFCELPLL